VYGSKKKNIDTPIYRLGGKKELVGKFSGHRRRDLLVLTGIYEFSGEGVERERVWCECVFL
jgi:hypothetical protein